LRRGSQVDIGEYVPESGGYDKTKDKTVANAAPTKKSKKEEL